MKELLKWFPYSQYKYLCLTTVMHKFTASSTLRFSKTLNVFVFNLTNILYYYRDL